MTVELTPNGSYGWEMPKMLRPLFKVMTGLSVAVFHLFGKRMRVMGRPLLLLTTVGARSGQYRQTPLGWFPDGDDRWLITATGAGSARHPTWYVNMARNPDQVWIEVSGRKLKVQPQLLKGAERDEAWKRIVTLSPGYGNYREKTDREIPVIRLAPVPTSPM